MKRVTIFLMVFVLLASVQGVLNAADDVSKITLEGVESFFIGVEYLSEDAKNLGLSRELIQSKVEVQLRKDGLPVVDEATKDESLKKPGYGGEYLYVQITAAKLDSGYFAFYIDLEFCQIVKLYRNGAWGPEATTWDTGRIGLMTSAPGKDEIIGDLLDLVDEFSNDFLSVNESIRD